MVTNVSGSFPGAVAAFPLAFAALIFLSGDSGFRFGTDRLLATKPLVWLGGVSYGIYLWHWPLMNLWLAHNDQTQLTFPQGVVVIELAIVLAWATARFVEAPIRRRRPARTGEHARNLKRISVSLRPIAALTVLALTVTAALGAWGANIRQLTKAADNIRNPGAAVLAVDYSGPILFERMSPSLTSLSNQWPADIGSCTSIPNVDNGRSCTQKASGDHAALTVAALGDSHTTTWLTALAPLAQERQWTLTQHGTAVVLIRDVPRFASSLNDCLGRYDDLNLASSSCAVSATDVLDPRPLDELLPDELATNPLVSTMDLSAEFCPENQCSPIIGGVVTYIDNNHPTQAYVDTLRPVFAQQFLDALNAASERGNA